MMNAVVRIARMVAKRVKIQSLSDFVIYSVTKAWEKQNKPLPPPHEVKQTIVKEYQKKSGYKILVETGTFHGAMVYAQLNSFDSIYSIELSEFLYKKAVKRFKHSKKVHLYNGDSGEMLGRIVESLTEPAIFWLDGHYSGGVTAKGKTECPIMAELTAIVNRKQPHILLIDDARHFTGKGDYPAIDDIQRFLTNKAVPFSLAVQYDVIRIELIF
jgi:hypothetical protein